MTQQINLLQQKKNNQQQQPAAPLYIALAVVAMAGVVIVLQGTSASEKTAAARRQVDAGAARLAQLTGTIQAAQAKQAANLAANAPADAAALQARADSARLMLAAASQGGAATGFSRQLAALNAAALDGVWLTAVEMGKAGAQVSLAGAGVSSPAVMQYATRVNQAFRSLGVRFNTVEVTPQGATDQAPPVVLFKLS